MADRG
jgi:hypothetical protein